MIKGAWGIHYHHTTSIIATHTSIISQFPVFRLASLLNLKLNLAHSTKYSTNNCNSMQISRKSYVQFSKYTQLNFFYTTNTQVV